jgi:hypothetical protein
MAVFSPLTLESRASRTERIRERHLSRQESTGRIRHRGVGGGEGEQTGNQTTHMHTSILKKRNSHWYREKVQLNKEWICE